MSVVQRILLIDFDSRALAATRTLLEAQGFAVSTAASKAEIEVRRSEDFKVVVLEPMIPGQDGFKLCQSLKRDSIGRPPAVFVASRIYRGPRYRGMAKDAGADAYFERPGHDTVLLEALHKLVATQPAPVAVHEPAVHAAPLVETSAAAFEPPPPPTAPVAHTPVGHVVPTPVAPTRSTSFGSGPTFPPVVAPSVAAKRAAASVTGPAPAPFGSHAPLPPTRAMKASDPVAPTAAPARLSAAAAAVVTGSFAPPEFEAMSQSAIDDALSRALGDFGVGGLTGPGPQVAAELDPPTAADAGFDDPPHAAGDQLGLGAVEMDEFDALVERNFSARGAVPVAAPPAEPTRAPLDSATQIAAPAPRVSQQRHVSPEDLGVALDRLELALEDTALSGSTRDSHGELSSDLGPLSAPMDMQSGSVDETGFAFISDRVLPARSQTPQERASDRARPYDAQTEQGPIPTHPRAIGSAPARSPSAPRERFDDVLDRAFAGLNQPEPGSTPAQSAPTATLIRKAAPAPAELGPVPGPPPYASATPNVPEGLRGMDAGTADLLHSLEELENSLPDGHDAPQPASRLRWTPAAPDRMGSQAQPSGPVGDNDLSGIITTGSPQLDPELEDLLDRLGTSHASTAAAQDTATHAFTGVREDSQTRSEPVFQFTSLEQSSSPDDGSARRWVLGGATVGVVICGVIAGMLVNRSGGTASATGPIAQTASVKQSTAATPRAAATPVERVATPRGGAKPQRDKLPAPTRAIPQRALPQPATISASTHPREAGAPAGNPAPTAVATSGTGVVLVPSTAGAVVSAQNGDDRPQPQPASAVIRNGAGQPAPSTERDTLGLERERPQLGNPQLDDPGVALTTRDAVAPPAPLVKLKELDEAPKLLESFAPDLSEEAAARGVRGRVFLNVLIGVDGTVKEARVTIEPGYGLGQAAQRAVMGWQYSKPTRRGEPVRVWKTEFVDFGGGASR